MDILKTSKLFFLLGVANGFITLAVTSLILIPDLRLAAGPGSILTHNVDVWPGAWSWVAYFTFLIVGVCGAFLWSLAYYLLKSLFGVERTPSLLTKSSLILYEAGLLATVSLAGYVGLVGGRFVAEGGSAVVVTALIGWAVIPSGAAVFLALLGNFLGLVNLVLAMVKRQ